MRYTQISIKSFRWRSHADFSKPHWSHRMPLPTVLLFATFWSCNCKYEQTLNLIAYNKAFLNFIKLHAYTPQSMQQFRVNQRHSEQLRRRHKLLLANAIKRNKRHNNCCSTCIYAWAKMSINITTTTLHNNGNFIRRSMEKQQALLSTQQSWAA